MKANSPGCTCCDNCLCNDLLKAIYENRVCIDGYDNYLGNDWSYSGSFCCQTVTLRRKDCRPGNPGLYFFPCDFTTLACRSIVGCIPSFLPCPDMPTTVPPNSPCARYGIVVTDSPGCFLGIRISRFNYTSDGGFTYPLFGQQVNWRHCPPLLEGCKYLISITSIGYITYWLIEKMNFQKFGGCGSGQLCFRGILYDGNCNLAGDPGPINCSDSYGCIDMGSVCQSSAISCTLDRIPYYWTYQTIVDTLPTDTRLPSINDPIEVPLVTEAVRNSLLACYSPPPASHQCMNTLETNPQSQCFTKSLQSLASSAFYTSDRCFNVGPYLGLPCWNNGYTAISGEIQTCISRPTSPLVLKFNCPYRIIADPPTNQFIINGEPVSLYKGAAP